MIVHRNNNIRHARGGGQRAVEREGSEERRRRRRGRRRKREREREREVVLCMKLVEMGQEEEKRENMIAES